MAHSQDDAKDFLSRVGLDEYIEELVVKNKFKTISDLKMLCSLDEGTLKRTNLPLCVVLKVKLEIEKLPGGDDVAVAKEPSGMLELSKKQLMELQKESMAAQYANTQLNVFSKFLSGKVNQYQSEGKWKGCGGLRVSAGTDQEQARCNCLLVEDILDSKEINYKTHFVDDHGIVTIDRRRGKTFIGAKLSHMRKPSAYIKKGVQAKDEKEAEPLDERAKTAQGNQPLNVIKRRTRASGERQENQLVEVTKRTRTSDDDSNERPQSSDSDKEDLEMASTSGLVESEYEKRRSQNIKSRTLAMLDTGVLDNNQSQCVALFYLKVSQMKFVSSSMMKKACKDFNVVIGKNVPKEVLCSMLGDVLYRKKYVIRIDKNADISRSNLKCTVKDH